MQAHTFFKAVTMDQSDLLDRLVALLETNHLDYCVIGGQAVNAYVEPLVSLDLDVVIAADQLKETEALLAKEFEVKPFPHSLNISAAGSDLRVQIQTDPRYSDFLKRAVLKEVLGQSLRVASLEDVLQGKIWAAQDSQRRGSKRQKDLADIARIIEAYPPLRAQVPAEILQRLL
jgi:hypothetical protein